MGAAHSDGQLHRELLGVAAANLCFSVERNEDLSNLEAIFDVLATRDEKLSQRSPGRELLLVRRGGALS